MVLPPQTLAVIASSGAFSQNWLMGSCQLDLLWKAYCVPGCNPDATGLTVSKRQTSPQRTHTLVNERNEKKVQWILLVCRLWICEFSHSLNWFVTPKLALLMVIHGREQNGKKFESLNTLAPTWGQNERTLPSCFNSQNCEQASLLWSV